jgi:hypothetical protein
MKQVIFPFSFLVHSVSSCHLLGGCIIQNGACVEAGPPGTCLLLPPGTRSLLTLVSFDFFGVKISGFSCGSEAYLVTTDKSKVEL